MIAIVVKKVDCFSGGSRSGVAGGVSDDCRGCWDVCGGNIKMLVVLLIIVLMMKIIYDFSNLVVYTFGIFSKQI